MNRLNRIALVVIASFTLGMAAAPAEADSRKDRRGGEAWSVKRGDGDGKRYEKADRTGKRDGYREARRDDWKDGDRRGRRDDDRWRHDDDRWRGDDWRRYSDDWRRYSDDWRRYGREFKKDRGHKYGWRIGQRPPRERVIVVHDYRERRYPRPPRDHYYVSIDRDVFLVAAATGIIIDVLRRD